MPEQNVRRYFGNTPTHPHKCIFFIDNLMDLHLRSYSQNIDRSLLPYQYYQQDLDITSLHKSAPLILTWF